MTHLAVPDAALPVAQLKKALRQRILALRDQIGPRERAEAGEVVFGGILALPEYRAARSVFAYAGFGSELDTASFLRQVRAGSKTLIMSKVDKATRALKLYQVDDLDTQLAPGIWGIREPDPDRCAPFSPDAVEFVLMPGCVFDVKCGRIGYGAGFYDKLLAPLAPMPYLAAAAFDVQVIDEVPMEAHDQRLDRVITATREFARRR